MKDILTQGEIIEVFEVIRVVNFHEGGRELYSSGYYISEYEANRRLKDDDYIKKHRALMHARPDSDKWHYYLLTSIDVKQPALDIEEEVVKQALAKLTKEERVALGFVEDLENILVHLG